MLKSHESYCQKNHPGEGQFPTFKKGAHVTHIEPCIEYEFWKACVIDGWDTFIPVDYVENGTLNCDYNPTELIAKQGSELRLRKIVYDWALAENENGVIGWIPFGVLTSK